MIRSVLKQIWNERRSNAWLWIELLVVSVVLWVIIDWGYVNLYTYLQPRGFNIDNTYRIHVNALTPKSDLYVPEEQRTTTTTGEDLLVLVERLRHHPDVESVSISANSFPYNGSNNGGSLRYDTIEVNRTERKVTPDFLNVFRYENVDGSGSQSLADALETNTLVVPSNIISRRKPDVESVKGKSFYLKGDSTILYRVAAVINPVRYDDFAPIFNMAGYVVKMEEKEIAEQDGTGINFLEVCLRVREGTAPDFPERLMKEAPRSYIIGNCYIKGVYSFSDIREEHQKEDMHEAQTRGYIILFLLANIFLGIIGTFWFRTQQRRGEMGLRIAMGSTPSGLKRLMVLEGITILILAFIPAMVISYNIGFADLTKIWQMEWGLTRFLPGIFVTFVLMVLMIVIGIWYPARQAMKIQPAEALHDE